MTKNSASRIRHLFQLEEVIGQDPNRPAGSAGPPALSLKAVFWCVVAIGISLAIGNLV
jgi:hypothetical protein